MRLKDWWQTGDESKQLTVLKALSDAKSPLLNEYMEKVAKSDNPSLQKVAHGLTNKSIDEFLSSIHTNTKD